MNTNKNNEAVVVEASTGTAFTYKNVDPNAERRECLCGCELQVVKKAKYRPGHDARHVSQVVVSIVEYTEGEKVRKDSLAKRIREGLAEFQSPKLIGKATARLMQNLDARHFDMIEIAANLAIEALKEDTDSE